MLKNNLLPRNFKSENENIGVLITLLILMLLGAAYSALSPVIETTGLKIPAFILVTILALAIQVYQYRKGGMIPKDGKPTVHSAIIFYSTLVAVAVIGFLAACLWVMLQQQGR